MTQIKYIIELTSGKKEKEIWQFCDHYYDTLGEFLASPSLEGGSQHKYIYSTEKSKYLILDLMLLPNALLQSQCTKDFSHLDSVFKFTQKNLSCVIQAVVYLKLLTKSVHNVWQAQVFPHFNFKVLMSCHFICIINHTPHAHFLFHEF